MVGDAYVFPGFLTPILTQLFFPKPLTTFLTCFWRGKSRKYASKKSRLNWGSNSQPPGHESDTPLTHPGGAKYIVTSLNLKHFILVQVDPFPNKPWFWFLCNQQFLLHPFGELSAIFIQCEIIICKLFPSGRV